MADFYTNVGTGINTLFDTTNDFSTAMDDLYYYEAKQKATFPYCVYSFLGDKPIYYFAASNPDEGEDIFVQFNIYDKTASVININKYEGYLRALFDWASITVTSYTLMEMRRDTTVPAFKVDDVWQITVTYRIKIDKT